MKEIVVDLSLEGVARVKNALDPIDPQDYVTLAYMIANGVGGSGGYQKYYVAPTDTYLMPLGVSSVITGPLDIEGVLTLEGRLEVL